LTKEKTTMRKVLTTSLSLFALLFAVGVAQAGNVTVKGVHLCCPQCVKIIGKTLGGVDGISDAACDRAAKTVSFTATDGKSAAAGIKALAKAGFHGAAAHGDKLLKFPASGAKKGDKADKIVFKNVHLCCGQCVKGVAKALADIKAEAACDRKAGTVTLTGSGIDIAAAAAALNKAGFNATLKK
jgi:copper chaperone CopZ